jgi:hypothetical protein
MEQHLGLRARVDEDERHAVHLDRLVDLGQRVARRVPSPGKLRLGVEDGDIGLRSLSRLHDLGKMRARLPLMSDEEGGKLRRPRHRRRQAYGGEIRRQRAQARKVEREKIAALGRGERVQLIDDDRAERAEQAAGVTVRQHERDLLWRGEQDVWRGKALALAA